MTFGLLSIYYHEAHQHSQSAQDEEAKNAEMQKQFHADDTQRCTSFLHGVLTPERKWAGLH